jgi:hypothetical protein
MDEQVSNPPDKPKQSTELRKLDHDGFFTNTFQMKRLAKAFLRIFLPSALLECLDLDGLVRLKYSRQDQWREDALLIMFECNKPWSFDRPPYLRGKLVRRVKLTGETAPRTKEETDEAS